MAANAKKPSADEKAEKKVYAPKVSVSSRGKINTTLELIAGEFRRLHPDQECRWVFDSAHNPSISNVVSRASEGYSLVKPDDFEGGEIPNFESFIDEKGNVRMADTVLMKIDAGQRAVNANEMQRLADAEMERVKYSFQEAAKEVMAGDHALTTRGSVKTKVVEKEVPISLKEG